MLPPEDHEGRLTSPLILAYSLMLVPVSLVPTFLGQVGLTYFFGALVLRGIFFSYGARLAITRSNALARRLVLTSVCTLPLVFGPLMLDKN